MPDPTQNGTPKVDFVSNVYKALNYEVPAFAKKGYTEEQFREKAQDSAFLDNVYKALNYEVPAFAKKGYSQQDFFEKMGYQQKPATPTLAKTPTDGTTEAPAQTTQEPTQPAQTPAIDAMGGNTEASVQIPTQQDESEVKNIFGQNVSVSKVDSDPYTTDPTSEKTASGADLNDLMSKAIDVTKDYFVTDKYEKRQKEKEAIEQTKSFQKNFDINSLELSPPPNFSSPADYEQWQMNQQLIDAGVDVEEFKPKMKPREEWEPEDYMAEIRSKGFDAQTDGNTDYANNVYLSTASNEVKSATNRVVDGIYDEFFADRKWEKGVNKDEIKSYLESRMAREEFEDPVEQLHFQNAVNEQVFGNNLDITLDRVDNLISEFRDQDKRVSDEKWLEKDYGPNYKALVKEMSTMAMSPSYDAYRDTQEGEEYKSMHNWYSVSNMPLSEKALEAAYYAGFGQASGVDARGGESETQKIKADNRWYLKPSAWKYGLPEGKQTVENPYKPTLEEFKEAYKSGKIAIANPFNDDNFYNYGQKYQQEFISDDAEYLKRQKLYAANYSLTSRDITVDEMTDEMLSNAYDVVSKDIDLELQGNGNFFDKEATVLVNKYNTSKNYAKKLDEIDSEIYNLQQEGDPNDPVVREQMAHLNNRRESIAFELKQSNAALLATQKLIMGSTSQLYDPVTGNKEEDADALSPVAINWNKNVQNNIKKYTSGTFEGSLDEAKTDLYFQWNATRDKLLLQPNISQEDKEIIQQGGIPYFEESNQLMNTYVDLHAELKAISIALATNFDPADVPRPGFWASVGEGVVSSLGYEKMTTTSTEMAQSYVNAAQKLGVKVSDEQLERIEQSWTESTGEGLGSSLKAVGELALTSVVGNKLRVFEAIGEGFSIVRKLRLDNLAKKGVDISDVKKLDDFVINSINFVEESLVSGLKFEYGGQDFSTGVGEATGGKIADLLGKGLPVGMMAKSPMGLFFSKLLLASVKKVGGATGQTLEEYTGEFFNELSKNDLTKAWANTVGEDPFGKLLTMYTIAGTLGFASLGKDYQSAVKDIETRILNYDGDNPEYLQVVNQVKLKYEKAKIKLADKQIEAIDKELDKGDVTEDRKKELEANKASLEKMKEDAKKEYAPMEIKTKTEQDVQQEQPTGPQETVEQTTEQQVEQPTIDDEKTLQEETDTVIEDDKDIRTETTETTDDEVDKGVVEEIAAETEGELKKELTPTIKTEAGIDGKDGKAQYITADGTEITENEVMKMIEQGDERINDMTFTNPSESVTEAYGKYNKEARAENKKLEEQKVEPTEEVLQKEAEPFEMKPPAVTGTETVTPEVEEEVETTFDLTKKKDEEITTEQPTEEVVAEKEVKEEVPAPPSEVDAETVVTKEKAEPTRDQKIGVISKIQEGDAEFFQEAAEDGGYTADDLKKMSDEQIDAIYEKASKELGQDIEGYLETKKEADAVEPTQEAVAETEEEKEIAKAAQAIESGAVTRSMLSQEALEKVDAYIEKQKVKKDVPQQQETEQVTDAQEEVQKEEGDGVDKATEQKVDPAVDALFEGKKTSPTTLNRQIAKSMELEGTSLEGDAHTEFANDLGIEPKTKNGKNKALHVMAKEHKANGGTIESFNEAVDKHKQRVVDKAEAQKKAEAEAKRIAEEKEAAEVEEKRKADKAKKEAAEKAVKAIQKDFDQQVKNRREEAPKLMNEIEEDIESGNLSEASKKLDELEAMDTFEGMVGKGDGVNKADYIKKKRTEITKKSSGKQKTMKEVKEQADKSTADTAAKKTSNTKAKNAYNSIKKALAEKDIEAAEEALNDLVSATRRKAAPTRFWTEDGEMADGNAALISAMQMFIEAGVDPSTMQGPSVEQKKADKKKAKEKKAKAVTPSDTKIEPKEELKTEEAKKDDRTDEQKAKDEKFSELKDKASKLPREADPNFMQKHGKAFIQELNEAYNKGEGLITKEQMLEIHAEIAPIIDASIKERQKIEQEAESMIKQGLDNAKAKAEGEAPKGITQSKKAQESRINKMRMDKFVDRLLPLLRKALPNVEVIQDPQEVIMAALNLGLDPTQSSFYDPVGNKVYLNKDTSYPDATMEEFAHLWLNVLEQKNPSLYNQGVKLIKGTDYEVDAKAKYGETAKEDGSSKVIENEALAQAIIDGSEAFLSTSITETMASITDITNWRKNFMNWRKNMWAWLGKKLGIRPSININKMTLDQFTRAAAADLLSNTELSKQIASGESDFTLATDISSSIMSDRNSKSRLDKMNSWIRKNLRSDRGLSKKAQEYARKLQGRTKRAEKEIEFAGRDFRAAVIDYAISKGMIPSSTGTKAEQRAKAEAWINKSFSDNKYPEAFKDLQIKLDTALKTGNYGGIPTELVKTMDGLRTKIDEYSNLIKDALILSGENTVDIEASIDSRMGTYVRRSYAAFDDPNYYANIKKYISPDELFNIKKQIKGMMSDNKIKAVKISKLENGNYEVTYTNSKGYETDPHTVYANDLERQISDILGEENAKKVVANHEISQNHSESDFRHVLTETVESANWKFEPSAVDVDNHIKNFIDRQRKSNLSEQSESSSAQKAAKSVLKKRNENMDEVYRRLLGEYENPNVNFMTTAINQVRVLNQIKFETDMLNEYQGNLITSEQTPTNTVQITDRFVNKKPGKTYWTTPEMAELFGVVSDANGSKYEALNVIVDGLVGLNAMFKANFTIFSPESHARNFLGAVSNLWKTGTFAANPFRRGGVKQYFQAVDIVTSEMTKSQRYLGTLSALMRASKFAADQGGFSGLSKAELEKQLLELYEYGLADQNIDAAVISDIVQSMNKNDVAGIRRGMKKLTEGFTELAGKPYQMTDVLFKKIGFDTEVKRLREIYTKEYTETAKKEIEKDAAFQAKLNEKTYDFEKEDMLNEEIESRVDDMLKWKAAAKIRAEQPTYSDAPELMKRLSRSPIAGSFVLFSSEVVRNQANQISNIFNDLTHERKRLQKLGYNAEANKLRNKAVAQLASMTASYAVPYMIYAWAKDAYGWSDDDEAALKKLLPDFYKNNNFIFLDGNKTNPSFLDLSYMDPNSVFIKHINAYSRGETFEESVSNVFKEIGDTWLSAEPATKKLYQSFMNRNDYGRELVKKGADGEFYKRWFAPFFYESDRDVIGPAVPGIAKTVQNIYRGATHYETPTGKQYDLINEILNATIGVKKKKLNVPLMAKYAKITTDAEIENLITLFKQDLKSEENLNAELKEIFERDVDIYNSLIQLGATEEDILNTFWLDTKTGKLDMAKNMRLYTNIIPGVPYTRKNVYKWVPLEKNK